MAIDSLDRLFSTLYRYSVRSTLIRRTLWLASPFARCRYSPLHIAASAATVEFRRKIKIRAIMAIDKLPLRHDDVTSYSTVMTS